MPGRLVAPGPNDCTVAALGTEVEVVSYARLDSTGPADQQGTLWEYSGDTLPNLTGWEAYCESCGNFRSAWPVEDGSTLKGYLEFVCEEYDSILLIIQKANRKPN